MNWIGRFAMLRTKMNLFCRMAAGWSRRFRSQTLVLMYHRVAEVPCDPWQLCVTPNHFEQQLDVLKRTAAVITAGELSRRLNARTLPKRSIVITFDDGYADNFTQAQPLLKKHGLPATLFLSTAAVDSDREFWWDELQRIVLQPGTLPEFLQVESDGKVRNWTLGTETGYSATAWDRHRHWRATSTPNINRERLYVELWQILRRMTAEDQQELLNQLAAWSGQSRRAREEYRSLTELELRQMIVDGVFEIAAHTVNHPALSTLSPVAQAREIQTGKEWIESRTGKAVMDFAYPYGDYSSDTVEITRRLGFRTGFTTREDTVMQATPACELPRYAVQNWTGDQLADRLRSIL
jgi:peptidoglycan/xylan/chitin deacetylase (PgdA/CDA1 family)